MKTYKLTADISISPKDVKSCLRLIKIQLEQINYETDKMKNGCVVSEWPLKNIKFTEVKDESKK